MAVILFRHPCWLLVHYYLANGVNLSKVGLMSTSITNGILVFPKLPTGFPENLYASFLAISLLLWYLDTIFLIMYSLILQQSFSSHIQQKITDNQFYILKYQYPCSLVTSSGYCGLRKLRWMLLFLLQSPLGIATVMAWMFIGQ